jgi:hypothetical protein
MDQDGLPTQYRRDTDLLAVLGLHSLLQLVPPLGDTAQAGDIVVPRQLDRVADMLTPISDGSVGALCSVFPSEDERSFSHCILYCCIVYSV